MTTKINNNLKDKITGTGLVAFARSKMGTPYIYGAKGTVITEANYNYLKNRYGKLVWNSDRKKIGKVCVDCSGLISWACGIQTNAAGWKAKAAAEGNVYPIRSIGKAPIGALVWMQGHIGIYTGKKNGVPHYIAADGSAYGVREVPITENNFTHWLLVESVFTYGKATKEDDDEVVEKAVLVIDGKEYNAERILKNGTNYIKIRDVADALGYGVSSKGNIAILTKKK